jgi:enoyl-CoA hydratase/carnithine racemase
MGMDPKKTSPMPAPASAPIRAATIARGTGLLVSGGDSAGGMPSSFRAGSRVSSACKQVPGTKLGRTMSLLHTEDHDAVRHLVLNRPEKRNALNGELIGELAGAVEAAAADASVRVVVVRGEGPMFSSGMDVGDLGELAANPEPLRSFRRPILNCWNLLEEMPKPTICQIHGAALGGAFELALACDLRTMAEDAVAGIMEVRIGLLPDVGGCSRLPAVVGLGNAKELIMTGRVIDGREAHRIGFANRIAPADALGEATHALAAELLACAPRAVGLAKRVMDAAAKPALAATLELEVSAQETLAAGEDFAEGARAFAEKRPPEFSGR